ncbi:MAG: hypothetical protein KC417_12460 [Myxococcales bacterium]|nr:hypothetical protein [Myxococcales bacterium]MCB9593910.1 hypothetical protein [Sandaracinaceae bacterium]
MRLIETLKERSTQLAETARDRGLGALDRVRSGTLDWHKTLEVRRAELEKAERPKWLPFGGLQIFVIDRVDRALERFSERVREEIGRLQQLELAAAAPKTAPAKKPKAKAKTRVKARAPKTNGKTSRRLVMPIADYDDLNAKDAVAEVARLTAAQAELVREHEVSHKNRKTVLKALDAQMA